MADDRRTAVTRRTCDIDGTRLDRFIATHWGPLSRRQTRVIIAAGTLRVNGRAARKGMLLQAGDVVDVETIALHDEGVLPPQPALPVGVLYEDADLIVIDKPPNMPSVALHSVDRGTVANFLAGHAPDAAAAGRSALEGGLVHRLDTGTSGVLLAARSPAVWLAVRQQFLTRAVGKRYVAWTEGSLREAGTMDDPIAHDPRRRRRMIVCGAPEDAARLAARPAHTRYRPVQARAEGTLVEVHITTGVRHQIRAHLAALGHPVRGDVLYGACSAPRLFLHAASLTLRHPADGRILRVESRLPAAFDG